MFPEITQFSCQLDFRHLFSIISIRIVGSWRGQLKHLGHDVGKSIMKACVVENNCHLEFYLCFLARHFMDE